MSTVSTIGRRAPLPPEPDPYRYGWRYVTVIDPDGTETVDQIPLTLEDVLFPEEGDFIVQTDAHDSDAMYLKGVFKSRLAGDPSAAVVSDCRVDWNLEGVRPLGPDIAAFTGVKRYRDWATLNVKAERARPLLVVEVTSRDTRKNDLELKPDFYRRARVPLYVIADVTKETDFEREIKLIAYALTDDDYVTVAPDHRGWIWLEPVRLWLGTALDPRGGYQRLACFDPDTGEEIGDYEAVTRALAAEAQAEHQRRRGHGPRRRPG